jgi:hypothetical protein
MLERVPTLRLLVQKSKDLENANENGNTLIVYTRFYAHFLRKTNKHNFSKYCFIEILYLSL